MIESNQELLEKTKFEVKQHESKLEELQSVIFIIKYMFFLDQFCILIIEKKPLLTSFLVDFNFLT